ncbi:hypothetical protein QYE76_072008 [Lolium multiflorum]|uniref:Uncharacterized protein n=1 Tax=Lolium multiflorum TaxID=4521 RepID=A0AAD8UXV9_LOLMU|nr:hypothetical protein QYE76_072008 [Lolium multiflorum]
MVVDVHVTIAEASRDHGEVVVMVSSTMPGRGSGRSIVPVGARVAALCGRCCGRGDPAPPKTGRSKIKSTRAEGNPSSKAKATNRVDLPPAQGPVNDAHNVFGDSSTTEFLSALNDSSMDVADGIPPFDEEIGDQEYDEDIGDEEDDDDVVEIEPGVSQ